MSKLRELIAGWRAFADRHADELLLKRFIVELEAALSECEPGLSDNDLYASYANHCAIEKKMPLTFHNWKREQNK